MRALVTTGTGPVGVELAEVDEPEPRGDQAVVEVRAVAVNRGDLMVAGAAPAGSRLGLDVAGVVVRAAEDGSGPGVGTRVVGLANRDGWGQFAALSTDRMAALPDDVADTAVVLPVAGLTAFYALRKVGWLLGKVVLITGAGGGVGRMAVQIAKAGGAKVIAWVGAKERMAGLAGLGADVVTTYDDAQGEAVDAVVDAAGGEVLAKAFPMLVAGGVLVSYGNTARQELVLPVDWGHARPGVRLQYLSLFDEVKGRDLDFLIQLRLDPQVAMSLPWTEASAAMAALRDRRVNGKIVLLP